MKKNKEWAKKEIKKIHALTFDAHEAAVIANNKHFQMKNSEQLALINKILEILNQLDEPEVLSFDWIEENKKDSGAHYIGYYVPIGRLHDLIVPKQELPVIPKYVAKYLEFAKSDVPLMRVMVVAYSRDELPEWKKEYDWIEANDETFARAWVDGYTVEEEPLYYAKLKEVHPPEEEWLTNLTGPNYYAIDTKGLMLGEFILNLVGLKTEASTHTLKDWGRYGINDSNADFVKVAE